MTTQAFEVQAVSDEELQAANGGRGGATVRRWAAAATDPVMVPPVSISNPIPNSSVPPAFRGSSNGTPGLGDAGLAGLG